MRKLIKQFVYDAIDEVRNDLCKDIIEIKKLPPISSINRINLEKISELKKIEYIPMKKKKRRFVKLEDNPLLKVNA